MSTQAAAEQIEAHMEAYWERTTPIPHGGIVLSQIQKMVKAAFLTDSTYDWSKTEIRQRIKHYVESHWPLLPTHKLLIIVIWESSTSIEYDYVDDIILSWK